MSEKTEFEQLLNQKADLEQEARKLEEERKQVEIRAREVCEKIIQELKEKNSAKREAINRLQAKADELESQLNSVSGCILESAEATANLSEDIDIPVAFLDGNEDNSESVIVAAVEDAEEAENVKTEQTKRKHLLF
jgi:chromosome segregation ATPase